MQLPEQLAHARNFNVAVRETGDAIVFMHRLAPGGTDRSYGIHVAELAGLPAAVVTRSRQVLLKLEGEHRMVPGQPARTDAKQLALFGTSPGAPDAVRDELEGLDVDSLTPLQALNRLAELKRKASDR
jgi:DNA mismatch repair protein MutS